MDEEGMGQGEMETDDPLWEQLKEEEVMIVDALHAPSYSLWTVKGVQPC